MRKVNKSVFSSKGLDELLSDPNPILDSGAPTSTGGINQATAICDALGIALALEPAREIYFHGWGATCSDAKPIRCSWTLTVLDAEGKPLSLTFDLVSGDSPLIVGLDVTQYTNTMNLSRPRYVTFHRPEDKSPRRMLTYVDDFDDQARLRLEIIPHKKSTITSLMANIMSRPELCVAKKIHRYTHATSDEMKDLYKGAGILTTKLSEAFDKVYKACEICCRNGRPLNSKKLSLTHVNKAFNHELQADFMWCDIKGETFIVLNLTDTSTAYAEFSIVPARNTQVMIQLIETEWICRHGAPSSFSSDPEFLTTATRTFLNQHQITFNSRPARTTRRVSLKGRTESLNLS